MQIWLLILVVSIFWHDGSQVSQRAPMLTRGDLACAVILPKLALTVLYALACKLTINRLNRTRDPRWATRLDSFTTIYRLMALGSFITDLYLGALVALRTFFGAPPGPEVRDLVLVEELILMFPPLAMLIWGWWVYYPIDRRLREAVLMRHVDEGRPIYPIWSRKQFVVNQLRHQLALMLVPLLLMMAWMESLNLFLPGDPLGAWLQFPGILIIFLFTPLLISRIWDTAPLPPGELRDMLVGMCRRHRVRVRQLLLWRTFGGTINAAVMGFIAPLRFILLSDALLDMLPLKQVEAVMAHELAHVRRHHMFWLLLVAAVSSTLLQIACLLLAVMLIRLMPAASEDIAVAGIGWAMLRDPLTLQYVTMGAGVAGWLFIFGWVSRRFERQADTFAVQHLTAASTVDAESAQTMTDALQQVADLNHIPTTRRSWRHGSIHWRQQYLRSLVGQPVDRLSIDRHVLVIQMAGVIALAIILGLMAASYYNLLPQMAL